MQRWFFVPLVRKTLPFFVVALLAGIALGVIPFLITARADAIEVGCDVTELINAINTANGSEGGDTINLAAGCIYTLTAVDNDTDGPNGLPSITSTITINGNGATIQRDPSFTCPDVSNPEFRIFHVAASGNLTLNDVTVSNGCVGTDYSGGGIYSLGTLTINASRIISNTANQRGGGIYSEGTLTVTNSTLSGNRANYGGGGISRDGGTLDVSNSTISYNWATYGGGIYNNAGTATAVISNTLIYSNTAETDGGGILNKVNLSISNSTFSGNTAEAFYEGGGGGIYNAGSATLDISHSTLSDNTAAWFGGGIHNIGTANIRNSIVANNTALIGNDCWEIITSQDYNFIEDTEYCTINGIITHTITGLDPALSPLQDNGGPTWTHALLEGSPAIDQIPYGVNGCGTEYTTDQRGVGRPQPPEGSCDIGAYEYEPPTPEPTPTDTPVPTSTPTPTPTPTFTVDVPCDPAQLIDAINTANGSGGATTINLASDCTYTLNSVQDNTDGPSGLPPITSEIIINGNGATIERSSADGTPQFRIFHVARDGNLTLNNLTITNGDAGGNSGGGIYNAGTLSINNSTISDNTGGHGGGIMNGGTLSISNSTVSNNTGDYGGGILNSGTLSINNSTLSGNTGSYGGAISGGGTLDITNSTFSGNTATEGGAIYGGNPVSINHSTFTANTATVDGGGICRIGGTVTVKNSIFADNTPNNCNSPLTSQGYNLESGTDCGFIGTGDLQGATANLGPLQYNGGPTWTHALQDGSPAIDAGSCTDIAGNPVLTDQRGYERPYPAGGNCDIGAFEYGSGCTLEGDVDNDGDVDIDDIMQVASRWRCQCGDDCYVATYDLDEDCDIDVVDIMLVVAQWGDTC